MRLWTTALVMINAVREISEQEHYGSAISISEKTPHFLA